MTLELFRDSLAWATIINWVVLILWFLFFTLAHDWMYRFHHKWFKMTVEAFDTIHYAGMAAYKIGIILICLAPYLALRIVG